MRAAAHDPVANGQAAFGFGFCAHIRDLADEFQADNGASTTRPAMRHAGGHHQVGAVQAAGADTHQNLIRFGGGGRHVLNLDAIVGDDDGFHGRISFSGADDLRPF